MYCMSLYNSNLEKIKKINYLPVGLGKDKFEKEWIRDNTMNHISEKNSWYGENTFYYWLWKNHLKKSFDADWVGFCHYRRFWVKDPEEKEFKGLNKSIIQHPSIKWNNHEVVLADEFFVNRTKISKILKHGKRQLLKNPLVFLSKKKITVKVHCDMYHGFGNLDKAIDLLENEDRKDFRNFVNSHCSFNAFNILICKSPELLNDYYNSLFKWLKKCESIFGFDSNKKYSQIRIYAFLAERYLSYWYKKNSNYILWPIKHYDISNDPMNF